VFSNFGYVLCHCFATSGFMMLRRDRPAWPRPIKVARPWVFICALLFLFDLTLLVVGSANVGLAYGASTRSTLIPSLAILVIALGLYVFRVVVQEKKPLRLRLPAPTVPEEEAAIGAPTSTI
jgi:amino acid transporter